MGLMEILSIISLALIIIMTVVMRANWVNSLRLWQTWSRIWFISSKIIRVRLVKWNVIIRERIRLNHCGWETIQPLTLRVVLMTMNLRLIHDRWTQLQHHPQLCNSYPTKPAIIIRTILIFQTALLRRTPQGQSVKRMEDQFQEDCNRRRVI
jgi:hypothetical protein